MTEDEKELIIECVQYRLQHDKSLNSNVNLREDLEELLFTVEDIDDDV